MFYFLFHELKTFGREHHLESRSATFSNSEIEKVTTQRGTGGRHRDVQRQIRGIPNRERDHKQIVPQRQKKKRGIQRAKKQQAEGTEVGEEVEQRMDNRAHALNKIPRLVDGWVLINPELETARFDRRESPGFVHRRLSPRP